MWWNPWICRGHIECPNAIGPAMDIEARNTCMAEVSFMVWSLVLPASMNLSTSCTLHIAVWDFNSAARTFVTLLCPLVICRGYGGVGWGDERGDEAMCCWCACDVDYIT